MARPLCRCATLHICMGNTPSVTVTCCYVTNVSLVTFPNCYMLHYLLLNLLHGSCEIFTPQSIPPSNQAIKPAWSLPSTNTTIISTGIYATRLILRWTRGTTQLLKRASIWGIYLEQARFGDYLKEHISTNLTFVVN